MTKPIGDNFFYVAFHTFGLFLYYSFMDRVLKNDIGPISQILSYVS